MSTRVLVVEDDEDMREMLVEALEEEGFAVGSAASGAEALRLAGKSAFDLLITDVRMGGMDGLETLANVKRLHPGIRSIIITGYASDDAPVRAIKLEAWDYLYKPFSLQELLQAVERVMQAEVEREKSHRLLSSLSAGFKRLVEAASTAVANQQLQAVDKLRDQAFASFYVSVRSRNLGMPEGMKVWDRLEHLEREREKLKTAGLHLKEQQALTQGYQYVLDLVSAYARNQMAEYPERGAGQVSRVRFADFHKRIQKGEIPAHQLSMAPFLRSLEPLTLTQSPELLKLYRTMWGEPGP